MTDTQAGLLPDMLRNIARKLTTYADIYTGDKEARSMAEWCMAESKRLRPSPPASAEGLPSKLEAVGKALLDAGYGHHALIVRSAVRALQASGAAVQVPEEWQLVPKKPTSEMLKDGTMTLTMPWSSDLFPAGTDLDAAIMGATYAAMLAAAPQKQGA